MSKARIFAYNILVTVLAVAISATAVAGELEEYEIKSGMLYNFANYIEWPMEPVGTAKPLEICIAGKNPSNRSFEKLSGKQFKNRKIVVRHLETPRDVNGCKMLFLNRAEQQQLTAYIREATKYSVLTVSDISQFASDGGIIGFVEHDGKIRFEINFEAAQLSRIKVSSKLLKLATIVSTRK